MQDKIVSVIGGSGFLGRYVVKHLAAKGYRVHVFCRRPHLADFVRPAGNVGQIAIDYMDLARPETIGGKLAPSYAVINLVGLLFESGSQRFSRVHAQGAERLAQEAAAANVEIFVQVSALGVDKAGNSAYARSKLEGEKAVKGAFAGATIVRPSVIFGAEDNFLNKFARMSRLAPALPAIGGGKTKFQPVYVNDVARAIVAMLERSEAAGTTYELGGPQVMSFAEILEYLGKVTGRERAQLRLPFPLARAMGSVMQLCPNPVLTADQVRLLEHDNVVSGQHPGFAELGIEPLAMASVVPQYLGYSRTQAAA